MKQQATRDEAPKPANGSGEKIGCIVTGIMFIAALSTVYWSPWVVHWLYCLIYP